MNSKVDWEPVEWGQEGWTTSRATEFKTKSWVWSKCLQGSRASSLNHPLASIRVLLVSLQNVNTAPLVTSTLTFHPLKNSFLCCWLARRAIITCNSSSDRLWNLSEIKLRMIRGIINPESFKCAEFIDLKESLPSDSPQVPPPRAPATLDSDKRRLHSVLQRSYHKHRRHPEPLRRGSNP